MVEGSRQKATEHTIAALRPLIGVVQKSCGIPTGFWRDEFVLGFFSFMLTFHRDLTSGTRLSDEDKGRVMADVLTALSNMNGLAIAREVAALATGSKKTADFETGADNAAVLAFFIVGKLKNADSNEHVIKAREMASLGGQAADHKAITGYLMLLLFIYPLRGRFKLARDAVRS